MNLCKSKKSEQTDGNSNKNTIERESHFSYTPPQSIPSIQNCNVNNQFIILESEPLETIKIQNAREFLNVIHRKKNYLFFPKKKEKNISI